MGDKKKNRKDAKMIHKSYFLDIFFSIFLLVAKDIYQRGNSARNFRIFPDGESFFNLFYNDDKENTKILFKYLRSQLYRLSLSIVLCCLLELLGLTRAQLFSHASTLLH